MVRLDLQGKKFGRLTAINIDKIVYKEPRSLGSVIYWNCKCDCGNTVSVRTHNLINGITKSCGCLQKERASEVNKKHGLSHSHLGWIWVAMKQRCENYTNKNYKDYGGRGIKVCEEWSNYFTAFYDWSISNGYKKGLSIDRIDNNGDYCPENCRWIDHRKQMNNTRRNRFITFNGETKTISEWAKNLGYSSSIIRDRLKLGWTIEKAITTPVRKIHKREA